MLSNFKLFNKYQIRLLRYPVLILGSLYRIDPEDFEKLKNYCFFVAKIIPKINKFDLHEYPYISIRIETLYIFEFKNITTYRRFLQVYFKTDELIKISNIKEFEIYSINSILFDGNSTIKITLETGTTFTTSLNAVYSLLETLYNRNKIDITSFDKVLHKRKLIPKEKSIIDKRQQSAYISFWYCPYRLLQEFGNETGLIQVIKPHKNKSTIEFKNLSNLNLEELKDRFYRWLLNKIRR